jgi:hypothetical protein
MMYNKKDGELKDSNNTILKNFKDNIQKIIPSNSIVTNHTIYREMENKYGEIEKCKIMIYTTSCASENHIRNAETGQYYPYKVGSKHENNFFKVKLATGECGNVTNTLFYLSPQHCKNHLCMDIDDSVIDNWNNKHA